MVTVAENIQISLVQFKHQAEILRVCVFGLPGIWALFTQSVNDVFLRGPKPNIEHSPFSVLQSSVFTTVDLGRPPELKAGIICWSHFKALKWKNPSRKPWLLSYCFVPGFNIFFFSRHSWRMANYLSDIFPNLEDYDSVQKWGLRIRSGASLRSFLWTLPQLVVQPRPCLHSQGASPSFAVPSFVIG